MVTITTSIPIATRDLERMLQRALDARSVLVGGWQEQVLRGGLQDDTTIYRLSGSADCDGTIQTWSLVLKTVCPGAANTDAPIFNYWKREALAYQSGFLNDLPGGFTAPRCYDVTEQPDGSIWIWMEDVQDDSHLLWSIEEYAQVARRLGQFNGAYLVGRPFPAGPWVATHWLRRYLENAAPMVAFIRQNPTHPAVQAMFPGMTLPLTLALCDESPHMLDALDRLPQTFCHQDAFRRNLFIRGDQMVAIDWSYTGIAPLGAELVPLVGASFGLAKFPSSQAKDLDRACFTAYLDGLREAGWSPVPSQVRKAYTITQVLRYIIGGSIGQILPAVMDETTRQKWAEAIGVPPEKAGETDPGIAAYLTSILVEVLRSSSPAVLSRFLLRTSRYALQLSRKQRSSRSASDPV